MKDSITKIQDTFSSLYEFIVRYRVTLFIITIAVILSVMLIDISMMSNATPTDAQIAEAEKSVKIIQFKEQSIQVIDSLKENNIEIDTLFDPNRYDPFN